MNVPLAVREEIRFVETLCRVYTRSLLTPEQFFLPDGKFDQHRLDAIAWAKDGDGLRRVAIEVTKCFQGNRVERSTPSQNEIESWRRLEERFARLLAPEPCIGKRSVKVHLIFADKIDRIHEDFSAARTRKNPQADMVIKSISDALAIPLREALYQSLKSRHPEIAFIPEQLKGVIAHAYVDAYADRPLVDGWTPGPGIHVEIEGLFGNVTTILPRLIGVDSTGIIEAAKSKAEAVASYKSLTRSYRADELWLLLVADGSSQMSLVATPILAGVREGIRNLANQVSENGRPFFDRVIFLAAGYWAPDSIQDWYDQPDVEMSFKAFDLLG